MPVGFQPNSEFVANEAAKGKQNYFSAKRVEKFERQPVNESKLPAEVLELLGERKVAREENLFGAADRIRDRLLELGYEVRDEEEGQKVYLYE